MWQLTPVLSHINIFSKKNLPVFCMHCQREIVSGNAQMKLGGGVINSSYQLPIYYSVFSPTHIPSSRGSQYLHIQDFLRFCSMDGLTFFWLLPSFRLRFQYYQLYQVSYHLSICFSACNLCWHFSSAAISSHVLFVLLDIKTLKSLCFHFS